MTAYLAALWKRLRAHDLGRLVVLSILVGIVAGFGSLVFNFLLNSTSDLLMGHIAGYVMPNPGNEGPQVVVTEPVHRWMLFLLPALGGLFSGLLVFWIAPEAEGHGTDAMIASFHHKGGAVRKRVPFIKTIASALTIGSGGSAGREGPIAQIGSGFGATLATWLKTSDRERRLLMLAGAGAGIGAVFRAPLGGAIVAAEVLYRDIEFESAALVPGFVASIVAYSINCGVTGRWGAMFSVPKFEFSHPLELPLYVLLGVVCALVGIVYVKVFYGVRDKIFRKIKLPPHVKPAIGGLVVGVIGFFLPQVLGMGYGWVQLAIDGNLPLKIAIAIVVFKIVATGFTISSGGSGGVFGPSMVIGGLLGASVGMILHTLFPTVVTDPAAFALVGMAGFFSGVSKTPIASLIMVSEMTSGYGLLVPLMLTTATAYMLVPKRLSIYENQLRRPSDSPAHEGEFVVDVLEGIRVKEAMTKTTKLTAFRINSPLREILEGVAGSGQHVFPVTGSDDLLQGVIYFDDIRVFFTEREVPPRAIIAQDLLAPKYAVVTLDEDLASALTKFRSANQEELPVVEATGSKRVVGVLGRRDIITLYHDKSARQRAARRG